MNDHQKKEILQELINIGVGQGAEVMNTLLGCHVKLEVPKIELTTPNLLPELLGISPQEDLSCVMMGYQGSLEGEVQLLFPIQAAEQMVSLITGDADPYRDMDDIRKATLSEIGNIVINAVMGSLSNLFRFSLRYTLPEYRGGQIQEILGNHRLQELDRVVLALTFFKIEELSLEGNIILFFSMQTYEKLEQALDAYADSL